MPNHRWTEKDCRWQEWGGVIASKPIGDSEERQSGSDWEIFKLLECDAWCTNQRIE